MPVMLQEYYACDSNASDVAKVLRLWQQCQWCYKSIKPVTAMPVMLQEY